MAHIRQSRPGLDFQVKVFWKLLSFPPLARQWPYTLNPTQAAAGLRGTLKPEQDAGLVNGVPALIQSS